jgi:erythromycin esterase-like protein
MSRWNADGIVELFEWIRHGGAATVTADVREVTGADPRPVQDWLEEARGSFLGPPPDLPSPAF